MQTGQHIFLVGFMGSGKTFWGQQLAREMAMPFLDLDESITQREQKSISDLFALLGEHGFRHLEYDALRSIPPIPNFVVATGGGTPCFFDNMDWMNAQGTTVFLDTPATSLVKRLKRERQKRPLLQSVPEEHLPDFVARMLASRIAFYQQSKCIFPQHPKAHIRQLVRLIKTQKEAAPKEGTASL